MSRYIKLEDVRIRLIGKVRFTTDPKKENEMHEDLANRLINEAEGQVEHDLSPRYATPFLTVDDGVFDRLPDRPTREIIRTLCEYQAVMRILDVDFGRGTAVNGNNYYENIAKRYKAVTDQLLERHDGYGSGWKYPPLLNLKLNWFNQTADDGYTGTIINTTSDGPIGSGSYPARRINDPSQTFWRGPGDDGNGC